MSFLNKSPSCNDAYDTTFLPFPIQTTIYPQPWNSAFNCITLGNLIKKKSKSLFHWSLLRIPWLPDT